MSTLAVKIKHAGKTYDVAVDLSAPGAHFKQQIFELTGIEPSKVKVVVKGGMLKDDADMSKLALKAVSHGSKTESKGIEEADGFVILSGWVMVGTNDHGEYLRIALMYNIS